MNIQRSTDPPSQRRARFGYTFVELLMVLLIIGVLTSVAVPRYAVSIENYRAEAAARRIAADLNRARRDARFTGVNREVQFSLVNNHYDMPGLPNPDDPSAALYRIALDATPYPAALVSVDFVSSLGSSEIITFDMHSQPTTQNLPLSSGSIVVRAGSILRSIVVNPVTGEATVP